MSLLCRRLDASDLAAFRALRLEALETEPVAFSETAENWRTLSDEQVRARLESPVFGIFRDATLVGMMGWFAMHAPKERHRATLVMVYVQREERGGSAASELLDVVLDAARAAEILQIELRVGTQNARAVTFYRNAGFQIAGTIPRAILHDGIAIDEHIMVRALDA